MQESRRIEYINPTSRALGRMTTILFRPFDFAKWFVLGFSAWLATLIDGGYSANFNVSVPGDFGGESDSADPMDQVQPALDYLKDNLDWVIPVSIGVFVLMIAIVVALVWVSSRGKFMFLDNVVYNRTLVGEPWQRFKDVGNSLFWWRLVFGVIVSIVYLLIFGGAGAALFLTFDQTADMPPIEWFIGFGAAFMLAFAFTIVFSYIVMLLEDFVIPMMYKHELPANGAWSQVLAVHRANFGRFVLFFLWKFVLQIIAGLAILSLMIVTCCIASCFLAIPYVGAVILLPMTVFFRGLGPEFFRQFGDEFDLWEGSPDLYSFEPGPGGPGHGPGGGIDPMPPPVQP